MTSKPTKQRGETLREVASMIRGMRVIGYEPDDLAQFFDDQAEANDILLEPAEAP